MVSLGIMGAPKKILILGGGFAGIYAFLALHKRYHRDASVEIDIVNRTDYFLFTPLLHEVATGGVSEEDVKFNIRSMLRCCLHDLVLGDVLHIDFEKKVVATTAGQRHYDVLIYALGAGTGYFSLSEDSQKYVVPLKTIEDARRVKSRLVGLFEGDSEPRVVVVGGGPTGVEVVAEVREYFDTLRPLFRQTDGKITIIHRGDRLLPNFHADLGARAAQVLEERGVEVIPNDQVIAVTSRAVMLKSLRTVSANLVIWAAGVVVHRVPMAPDVAVDAKGRVIVAKTLQIPERPEVFVVGDAAAQGDVPMTAQAAVAMGEAAARNAVAYLDGKELQPFVFKHRGDLFSLGQWLAGAEIFGIRFFGHFAWWLWRTVYLFKIIGIRNKVRVMVNWTFNLFLPRDIGV